MASYTIRQENGITEIALPVSASVDDIKAAIVELAEGRQEKASLRLWDISKGLEISASDAREVAKLGKTLLDKQSSGRAAVVADSDLEFGMARLETVHREHTNSEQRVFRSRSEAIEWLLSEHD